MSVRISDTDNAIATRDKLIDDQRRKIDEYKYKYYNALDEPDKANHDLDNLQEKFDKLLFEHRNLQQKYQNLKEDSYEDRKGFDVYAEKVESDMKEKLKENKTLREYLDNAKLEIKELKEELEDKNIEISTMQHTNNDVPKFTSETQTSLQEELALNVNKFSKEKNDLISKFTSLQSKINLQLVNLVESVKQLNEKKAPERCVYGWNCTRKFCKYDHEYLYTYTKIKNSKCDEIVKASAHVKVHTQTVHRYQVDHSENLHKSDSEEESKTLEAGEEYESNISQESLLITSSSSSFKSSSTSSNSADSLKS